MAWANLKIAAGVAGVVLMLAGLAITVAQVVGAGNRPVAANNATQAAATQQATRPAGTRSAVPASDMLIRVVGEDGKPVRGAKLGTGVSYAELGEGLTGTPYHNAVAVVGWRTPEQLPAATDERGEARLPAEYVLRYADPDAAIYALHEGSGRVGLALVSRARAGGDVEVTLRPACRVFGRLSCKWLTDRGVALNTGFAYLSWSGVEVILSSSSSRQQFEFLGSSGSYSVEVGGWGRGVGRAETGGIPLQRRHLKVEVKEGQGELDLGQIELEPEELGKLVGQPAPDLTGIRFWKNGEIRSLKDLNGRYVLLFFPGPFLGDLAGSPTRWHDRWKDKGLTVVAVLAHDARIGTVGDLDAALAQHLKQAGNGQDVPFPVAMDGPGKVRASGANWGATHDAYRINILPTRVLIGRDGRILQVMDGLHDEVMEGLLDKDGAK